MKRSFSILTILALLIISCGQKQSKDSNNSIKSDLVEKGEDVEKNIALHEKVIADLQKMESKNEAEMKPLLPANMQGIPLTDYAFTQGSDVPQVNGQYALNDSTKILVTIYDCAGDAGAGLYSLQYASQLDYTSIDENESWSFPMVSGNKAIEHCVKSDNECSLTCFTGGRYLVMMRGIRFGPGELKAFVGELNIQ